MKYLLGVLFVLLLASMAHAVPFLVCDPTDETISHYVVEGLPVAINAVSIQPDVSKTYGFKLDLSALPVGDYTVRAKACIETWGCSEWSLPFVFKRPAPLRIPGGIKLGQ
jgi:hypothetical protein